MKHNLKRFSLFLCLTSTLFAIEETVQKIETPKQSPLVTVLNISQFPDITDVDLMPPPAPANSPTSEVIFSPNGREYAKQTIRRFIDGFSRVMAAVTDVNQQNVHILDPFMQDHIPTHLLKIVQYLSIGNIALTKEQISAKLKEKTPDILHYESKPISKEKLHQYIDKCVNQAFTQSQTQELFSRYLSLLIDIDDQEHYNTFLLSVTENYETGGGCWQGVRNRAAIAFAYIVAHKIDAI